MKRYVLIGASAMLVAVTTAATAYAMACGGGPAVERWALQLEEVLVDGEVVEDRSDYDKLSMWLSSLDVSEDINFIVHHEDFVQRESFVLSPKSDDEAGGDI